VWALAPDERVFVAAGRELQVYPAGAAEPALRHITPHESGITGLALTPDGEAALTCTWGSGTLCLTDLQTGQERRRFFDGARWDGQAVAIAPDGRRAAAWLRAGGVKLFDLWGSDDSAAISLEINSSRDKRPVALSFSPDGRLLATVDGDEKVVVFDAVTGAKRHAWQLPGPVSTVAFAADGRHLATANGNGTIYILRFGDRLASVAIAEGFATLEHWTRETVVRFRDIRIKELPPATP
jgi:WD40 repeat protein